MKNSYLTPIIFIRKERFQSKKAIHLFDSHKLQVNCARGKLCMTKNEFQSLIVYSFESMSFQYLNESISTFRFLDLFESSFKDWHRPDVWIRHVDLRQRNKSEHSFFNDEKKFTWLIVFSRIPNKAGSDLSGRNRASSIEWQSSISNMNLHGKK